MKNILKSSFLIISALLFSAILTSCEGDPGPAGPKGDPGEPGPAGPKGDPGTGGSASVFTAIYEQNPETWSGGANGYKTELIVPEITEDIYENGAVLVYSLDESNLAQKKFNMLPYTYIDNASFEYLDFNVFIGKIEITLKWVDNGVNTTEAPGSLYIFKVVIIKGIPLATLKKNAPLHDYDATIKYLKNSKTKFF